MHVLIAPDSFKGSLDPTAVAQAIADGWRRGRPLDEIRLIPLADGGEGTLEAIKASRTNWQELPVHARDPLGRPLRATFLRRDDAGAGRNGVGLRSVAGGRCATRRVGRVDIRHRPGAGCGNRAGRAPGDPRTRGAAPRPTAAPAC